ncbi:MAG TPA: hypothetical protein PLX97_08410 [Gemmatales bacterium]|nr:hypothetical protein [Gemmatales bacterium]
MLTTIGKTLVYTTLILSLVGLGMSVWAVADTTDYGKLTKSIGDEYNKLKKANDDEVATLKALLDKVLARDTRIPRGPEEIKNNKDVTIAEALKEAGDIEAELKKLFDSQQTDVLARRQLIDELSLLRSKLSQEKETGNNLRLIMYPDEARAREGQRSFRDIIASLQVAKEEVEKRIDGMQPDLYNSSIRLQNLLIRLKGLQDRAKELDTK